MFRCTRLLLRTLLLLLLRGMTTAYDIGCVWPDALPDDLILARDILEGIIEPLDLVAGITSDFNQPTTARKSLYLDGCSVLCLAFHDPEVLNPFVKQPTFVTTPAFGHNAYSMAMCSYQCWMYVYEDLYDLMPNIQLLFNGSGVNVGKPSDRMDIQAAMSVLIETGDATAILQLINAEDFLPYTMGHVVGNQIRQYMRNDGFNDQGLKTWCPVTLQEVDCTANCRKFQDTIGYNPVPDPRIHSFLSSDASKYDCSGLCRRWQPEQNMGSAKGTISREEAALPHIGEKATTYLGPAEITLSDPFYDYRVQANSVVNRLRDTASDYYKKQVVSVFHGDVIKGMSNIKGPIIDKVRTTFYNQHSYQSDALFQFFMSMTEYDGIIQVWREKYHHDLVRPTTVIKQWGNDTINTFGGDINANAPMDIYARDFEAVLPFTEASPEFPSENSCFCTALMEFIDAYTTYQYNGLIQNIAIPALDTYIVLNDMTDLRFKCAQGQIWGGFHFDDSVIGGIQKCTGLGNLASIYMFDVVNQSNFNGGWNRGDTAPVCSNT